MRPFARRALLVILDPHPRWWASLWFWALVCYILLAVSSGVWPRAAENNGFLTTLHRDVEGRFSWDPPAPGLSKDSWSVDIKYGISRAHGYRRFEAQLPSLLASSHQTIAAPVEAVLWMGDEFSKSASDRELRRGFRCWSRGETVEVWRAPWRWPLEGIPYVAFALVGTLPLVWCLRATQSAWHKQQLARLDKKQCTRCQYDLSVIPTGICPECGTDSARARCEAVKALRLAPTQASHDSEPHP
jgi:hypothetical protein